MKKRYWWLLIGSGGFLASRLINLTIIPIFTDEAIYIRWAQIAVDSLVPFISLTDGKQPLMIWLMMLTQRLPLATLVSSRLASVLAGLISFVVVGWLSWRLWRDSTRVWLSRLVYLLAPFYLFYDRLAIYDSLLASSMLVCLWLEVVLAQNLTVVAALGLGLALGLARLVKSSALFAILLLPLSLVLVNWRKSWQQNWRRLFKWLALSGLAVVLSELIQSVQRLSSVYFMIGQKNQTFILSWQEFWAEPFSRFGGNLRGMGGWVIGFLTLFLAIMALISSFSQLKSSWFKKLLLLAWFIFPFAALAAFGRVLFPRFTLFMTVSLIPLIADGLVLSREWLETRVGKISWLVYILVLAWPVWISFNLLFYPQQAIIPQAAKAQYISAWPSGGGVKEAAEILVQAAEAEPIFVATEGTFGLMPYALEIYLYGNPQIEIKGYWPIQDAVLKELTLITKQKPVYMVFYQRVDPPADWPLELVYEYPKAEGEFPFRLYKLKIKEANE